MLFFWSTKTRTKKLGAGVFRCARCGGDRPYGHFVARRWLHLYGVPLFPVSGPKGEYVRCDTCQGTYNTSVIGLVPAAE